MKRQIQSPQRGMRALAFRVVGTGTASISEGSSDAALTYNGVGDYTLTFSEPFSRIPSCIPAALAADQVASIGTVSITAVQVKIRTVSGTPAAADGDFQLIVMGSDVPDQI